MIKRDIQHIKKKHKKSTIKEVHNLFIFKKKISMILKKNSFFTTKKKKSF